MHPRKCECASLSLSVFCSADRIANGNYILLYFKAGGILHPSSFRGLPPLTLPYVMVTFALLMVATMKSPLRKIDVTQLSYPEMHRRLFRGGNCVDDDANVFVT